MSLVKTPYSVIRDLGKIVPRKYFMDLEIEGKAFKFVWDEPTVLELLTFIRNIDSAFEKKGLKYQVSVEVQVFKFLNKLQPEFTQDHFNLLTPESVNTIIETIMDPFFPAEQSEKKKAKGDGDLAKKKALKTPALD